MILRALLPSLVLAAGLAGHAAAADSADDAIWIEGEAAKTSNLTRHSWYADVKTGLLSGGAMASHYDAGKVGEVSYEVTAAKAGRHTFWVRTNFIAVELKYQLNGGEWKAIDVNQGRSDDVNIASNNAPDMRFLGWVKVGDVELNAGANALAFQMSSGNNHHGMIDCFLFTTGVFSPNGALKPGQKLGLADPGTWAFEPDSDPYDKGALLDLRSMNEKKAGEKGWITRTPDGDFATGDGKPIRFWGAVTGVQDRKDLDALRAHARHLAKRGINMVRYHSELSARKEGSKVTDINEDVLEKLHLLVAAMKDEGIYVTFNPFWAVTGQVKASWNVPGIAGGNPWGMVFWDETLQTGYKAWLKELFTRPNPHTGIPLGKDPAFAIFIVQNEDSMLFWTQQGLLSGNKAVAERLSERFGAWLAKKYGSAAQAKEAWGADAPAANSGVDDFANGKAGFLGWWEFNPGQGEGKARRLADQLHFLSETMRDFNAMIEKYIHEDLKCPMLVCAGNWRTANQNTMLDAERWSYDANDVIGCNRYTGGVHVNPAEGHKSGYLVSTGDQFTCESNLLFPRKIPISGKQVAGKPFIVPESTWVPPELYQAEGPFLVAAYGALTGFDIYYWFSLGQVGYDPTLNKWQSANPAIMGGWPAASLLFRSGYVKKAAPAVHEERRLDDIWGLKSSLLVEEEGFDPNRDASAIPKDSAVKQAVDPLAFLVGPVEVVYGGDPAKSTVADLGKYIDNQAKTVTSSTNELKLNYGVGVCTLDAPKAQGVSGFLSKGGGSFPLSTVTVVSKNDYATVLVVAMDDKELKGSRKILVQTTTTCRPHGWKQSAATFEADKKRFEGFRIDDTGSVPWNVANTQVTVTIRNPGLKKATLLDANGYAVKELTLAKAAGGVSLELPADALYVVVE
jgi:hypothetical protein